MVPPFTLYCALMCSNRCCCAQVPWCLQRKFLPAESEEIAAAHGVEDPTKGVVVFQRYCHVYKKGELEDLLLQTGCVRVVSSWYERSNWCVIAEKE